MLASAGGDSAVKLWLTKTGQRLDTFGQPTGEQFVSTFSPDSQYVVAAGADKQIRLWQWISKTRPQINPLTLVRFAHEDEITALAISADGKRVASTSADRTVKVWSMPKLKLLQQFDNQPDVVSALSFDHSGKTLHIAILEGSTSQMRMEKAVVIADSEQKRILRPIAESKQTVTTEKLSLIHI